MSIKYEIHTLNNAEGKGEKRKYVTLRQRAPMTEGMMEKEMQDSCTLTKGDVGAVFTELREMAVRQLSEGARFCLPGIGWLSLSVGLSEAAREDGHKITGSDVIARGILFKANRQLLQDVTQRMGFEQSSYSTLSVNYGEEELWRKVSDYLDRNGFITRRDMRQEYGLSPYKAIQWLRLFESQGKLARKENRHMHIYMKR